MTTWLDGRIIFNLFNGSTFLKFTCSPHWFFSWKMLLCSFVACTHAHPSPPFHTDTSWSRETSWYGLRCALFWDIMRHCVVIVYWHFGTTYPSHQHRGESLKWNGLFCILNQRLCRCWGEAVGMELPCLPTYGSIFIYEPQAIIN
jgi:hypothetical protein